MDLVTLQPSFWRTIFGYHTSFPGVPALQAELSGNFSFVVKFVNITIMVEIFSLGALDASYAKVEMMYGVMMTVTGTVLHTTFFKKKTLQLVQHLLRPTLGVPAHHNSGCVIFTCFFPNL